MVDPRQPGKIGHEVEDLLAQRIYGIACAYADANDAARRAQVWTLRERLLKLGAQVGGSVRRVLIHLPVSFPFLRNFRKIALAFGSSSG
ncbi:MAG: transposase [Acidobacteria bacterium]|nr:transposase [Acidobacteriota bacterium]